MYHPTKYWHKLDDGRVQCDVCPRACKMHEGQRGLCFVRGVEDGEVKLYTYGRSSGFCVDPDREEAAESFPAGHLGAVVRHRRLQSRLQVLPELGHEQVARDGHARGSRDAGACSRRRRSASDARASRTRTTIRSSSWSTRSMSPTPAASVGVRSVAVTAGYMCPQPRAEFYRHMDAANVDLKGFTERFYRKICGARARRGAGDAASTCGTKPRCGSRSRRC